MRKLIASIFSICFFFQYADARQIGVNPLGSSADVFCFGGRIAGNIIKNANEVCIDANGDIIPTENGLNLALPQANNVSLGTASFPWGTTYLGTQVFVAGIAQIPGQASIGTSPFIVGMTGTGFNGSSCGNPTTGNPTMITGSDFAGVIVLGTGGSPSVACTMGFNPVYVNTPICSVTLISATTLTGNSTLAGQLNPIILPTSIQFNTSVGSPGKIDYICVGQTQ